MIKKKRTSEFGSSYQRHVVACFTRLPEFAVRFRALITEDIIDDPDLADIVAATRKVLEDNNGILPSKAALEQEVPKLRSLVRDLYAEDIRDRDHVASKVARYAQQKACERAVYDVAKAIKDGNKDGIVTILQEALQVGLDISNIGEYLRDYKQRIPEYLHPEIQHRCPTGLTHLDLIMGGGLAPGELGIVAASAKAGKSVFLANVAFNVASGLSNKKAIYYSLEMVQRKVLKRLDTLTAGSVSEKMKTDPRKFTEALKDRMGKLVGGNVLVKSWPTRTCNYSMMSAHLSRCIALGFDPDCILVDYGDIMKPERRLGEPRHEIAGCFEDLRKMAGEFGKPIWSACFPAGTLIETPRGQIAIEKIKKGDPVYSYDREKKEVCIETAKGSWLDTKNAPLVEVDLDNGSTVRCTPNHPFLLRDSLEYCRADKLKPGDSIMPFVRRPSGNTQYNGYDEIYMGNGRFALEHRVVGEWKFGKIPKGMQIHHMDHDRKNNSDLNLEMLHIREHYRKHGKAGTWGPAVRKRIAYDMRHDNPMFDPAIVEKMRKSRMGKGRGDRNAMRNPEVIARFKGPGNPSSRPEVRESKRRIMTHVWSLKRGDDRYKYATDLLLQMGRHLIFVYGRLTVDLWNEVYEVNNKTPVSRFGSWAKFVDAASNDNHKVVAVRHIEDRTDVWSLEVNRTHNYALAAGVFVKNTQLNRGAMNKATPDMADMAESYEKVQIADAIIGIGRTSEEAQNKTCRFIAMGLRDEKSNLVVKVHDDRSRMLMKTTEILTPSAKKDKNSADGKQEQRREDAKRRMKERADGEEHES